jgi:hypothetical protein
MEFEEKYIKYKIKYLNLLESKQNEVNIQYEENMFGGGKFKCNPEEEKYKDICIPDPKGKYKSKESCMNDCDRDFITSQLKKANLFKESVQFYYFIKDLIKKENMKIYIKGGNVIGLAVLKLIYDKYKDDDCKFSQAFEKFLDMELIKDWDFQAYTDDKKIDETYRTKLDHMAAKYKLVPRAKTFILYQTKYPIEVYEKALFEIAILDTDSNEYSKLEIPLTTMKVRINEFNLKYIFVLAKSFYSWTTKSIPIDLDIVKKVISKLNIIIHPNKFGLYDPKYKLDTGEVNENLINLIQKYTKKNIFWTQFLITQLEDPYRIIYRMPDKNLKKTEKIIQFIDANLPNLSKPSWLLDVNKTNNIINGFIKELGSHLAQIYKETHSLDEVLKFLEGSNFGKPQIQIEWDEFDTETKSRLKKIFEPVVKQIKLDKFKDIIKSYGIDSSTKSTELSNSGKIIKLLGFLIQNKVF